MGKSSNSLNARKTNSKKLPDREEWKAKEDEEEEMNEQWSNAEREVEVWLLAEKEAFLLEPVNKLREAEGVWSLGALVETNGDHDDIDTADIEAIAIDFAMSLWLSFSCSFIILNAEISDLIGCDCLCP